MLVEFDNEKEHGSFHFYVGWLSVGWINKPGFFSSMVQLVILHAGSLHMLTIV